MEYQLIKSLIEKGKTKGLDKKISVFYADDKLTEEQYKELSKLIKSTEKKSNNNK